MLGGRFGPLPGGLGSSILVQDMINVYKSCFTRFLPILQMTPF